jgi:hypothetical protein
MATLHETLEREGLRAAVNPQRFNVAGILFTYRCSAACRHCLFACRPERPPVVMALDECVAYLRVWRRFPRVIHIAGGECFLFYDELLAVCRAAAREGVAPHFIETNGSWCEDDAVTRQRFTELRDLGLRGVLFSCDAYHQEFVPPDHVARCARVAVEVFGERNVIGNTALAARAEELVGVARDEAALREVVRRAPPQWMTGNAAKFLARHLDPQPLEAFAGVRCPEQFDLDRTWEFHFDPYGNLQTNCGVVLGNAKRTPPLDLLTPASIARNPVVQVLCEAGPVGLLRLAVTRGLTPRGGYVHKCDACFHARAFLRPHFPHILCPDEVYTP